MAKTSEQTAEPKTVDVDAVTTETADAGGEGAITKAAETAGTESEDGETPVGAVHDKVAELTTVLTKALRALGSAGYPVKASRLGGRAWWILRDEWPRDAERVNGTMHYLARLPEETDRSVN